MDVSPAVQDGKGAFIFDCETFRLETSSCERNAESLVCQARAFYPELAHWARWVDSRSCEKLFFGHSSVHAS